MTSTDTKIQGYATPEGTKRYFDQRLFVLKSHIKEFEGLCFSDLGIGTYLGEFTDEADRRYQDAIELAVDSGVNVIDSAINYRFQRSERVIGRALKNLIEKKKIKRDEVILATKGGFLSFDNSPPSDPAAYMSEHFFSKGIISSEDIVAGCHCMHPDYIDHELENSRRNLGVETIDVYYLHNVETQLAEIAPDEFYQRLKKAFQKLEKSVQDQKIKRYGLATWDAFRISPESQHHHSLKRVVETAEEVAGKEHHFKVVQLPFNLAFREAALSPTQETQKGVVPFLEAARERDIWVMASIPLFQGRLLGKLPAPLVQEFPKEAKTDAQRSIGFTAAAPGMGAALVGMSRNEHVRENTDYLKQPILPFESWRKIVDNLA